MATGTLPGNRTACYNAAMAIEIERKFLVCDDRWRSQADKGSHYRQGYLSHDPRRCVRIMNLAKQPYTTW